MMNRVIVGLGSNISPEKNIQLAFKKLGARYEILRISGPVKTAPLGITEQPVFFNAAVLIKTIEEEEVLVKHLKEIEDEMGRDRSRPKYGPREIDLDILVWNGEIVDKDYYERDFLQKLVQDVLH